jgi:hypothetical protein
MFFSELSDSQMILKSELREARRQNELLTEAGEESLRIAERWKELHEVAAIELRETQKRVRELESEIEVRDNSANIVFDTLKAALPNRGFHSEMEAAEAAAKELAELRAVNDIHAAEFAYAQKGLDEIAEIFGDIPSDPNHVIAAVKSSLDAREREAGMLAWQALVTEAIGDAFEIAEDLNASVEFEGKAHTSQIVGLLRPWLNTMDGDRVSPPAALDDLRRRERSIGAEEELRRLAAEDCGTVFHDDLPHVTQNQLIDRADAIAAERDHITDAGKKVNHPEIPESSGGER